MESLGWRVYPGYAVLYKCQATCPKDSTAPAINGNACFSVFARPEDRVVMSVRSEEVALLSRGIPDAYTGRVMARCAGGRQG